MWLFGSDSFLSIVQHNADPDLLIVRARRDGDLERLFPDRADDVASIPGRDYLFRLVIPRAVVADKIREQVMNINYGNFKGSIPKNEHAFHNAAFKVWDAMAQTQPLPPVQHADLHPQTPKDKQWKTRPYYQLFRICRTTWQIAF